MWVVPYLAVLVVSALDDGAFDPVWNGSLEYLYLAAAVVVAVLAVTLLRESNRTWAVPDARAVAGRGGWASGRPRFDGGDPQARFDERG